MTPSSARPTRRGGKRLSPSALEKCWHASCLVNGKKHPECACMCHDAALRSQAKTKAEERLIRAALRWIFDDTGRVDYTKNSAFARAARAVAREREVK